MYSFDARVRYSECDDTGCLSLFSAMNYLQDCSTFQSVELAGDLATSSMAGRGLAWVLANWRIEVDRLPSFGEKITISTWCYEMTRAHALRNFRILAGTEDLVRANSQWFVFDTTRGRATRVPDDQRAYLSGEPPLDMPELSRRLRPEGPGTQAGMRRVARHDLDTNRHVNNARYVALALEALEEAGQAAPAPPLTLQVQYRTMAFLGDAVIPVIHPCTGGVDVNLTNAEGSTYALVRIRQRQR